MGKHGSLNVISLNKALSGNVYTMLSGEYLNTARSQSKLKDLGFHSVT